MVIVLAGFFIVDERPLLADCTHSVACQLAASGINRGSVKVSYMELIRKTATGQLRPVVKRPATDRNKRIADPQIVQRNNPYPTHSGPTWIAY